MSIRLRLIEIVCVVIFSLFVSCKQTELKLTIENPSSLDCQEELVPVPLSEIELQILSTKQMISGLPNVVATQDLPKDSTITYYTGFGWNKSGFQDVFSFQLYMKAFSENIAQPFNIKYQ